jgi:HSP20 family protein
VPGHAPALPLPVEVPAEQITATYKDGMLEVRVPKPAQPRPQPRRIPL